ncbi:MAG: SH3 domain-containing protein [Pleurocapsa sp. MO_226.B13]|nr:SH3 domain-containing protein [Pleurocapsa sp. MO_226.B13]
MITQAYNIKIIPSITGLVYFLGNFLAIVGCQPPAAAQECQTKAYVVDTDPQGLNVRTKPDSQSEIRGTLPLHTEVDVFQYQGNWLLVSPIDPELQEVDFKGEGWVYASLLGLNTRGYNSDGVPLYAEPNKTSEVTGHAKSSSSVTMVSCSGEWVLVKQKNLQGWLEPEEQCAAALTTCP